VLAGLYLAVVFVLAWAGAAKVARPGPTRLALRTAGLPSSALAARALGLVELGVAGAALAVGGRLPAALAAAAYLGFAGFSEVVRRRSRGRAGCGCFGSSGAPLGRLHVVVDLVLAAVALGAAAGPLGSARDLLADSPAAGLPLLGYALLLAWLIQVLLTAVPDLQAALRPRRTALR